MAYQMNELLGLDLDNLSWHHMIARAVVVFIYALILIQLTGMRTFGTKSAFDIVLGITIGGVLSRAITGHYPFFAVVCAAAALAVCHRILGYLSIIPGIRLLMEGKAICIYEQGQFKRAIMKRRMINEEDIHRSMRQKGLEDITKIKSIWFEVDGKISFIKY